MRRGGKRMGIVLGIVLAASVVAGLCCILQKQKK